jgi:hypothetical protein
MKTIITIAILFCSFVSFGQIKDNRDDGRKIRIPVLFHVIYSNTQYTNINAVYRQSDNICDSLILQELNDLNLDCQAKNDMSMLDNSFRALVGNPNLEFYLAGIMLQPNGSKGIQRVPVSRSLNTENLLIDPAKYLNVFIGSQGNNSNILGDRVNVAFSDIGLHSHVLTHETGHWLGLWHIWGKIGSCGSFKARFGDHDDEIEDTPEQYKCSDLKFSSCPPLTNQAMKRGEKAIYNNFMDYSVCRCMFTIKQSIQVRNKIIASRSVLFLNSQ